MKKKFIACMIAAGCAVALSGCSINKAVQTIGQVAQQGTDDISENAVQEDAVDNKSAGSDEISGGENTEQEENTADSSSSEEPSDGSAEEELENNPEYIALREKIAQSKAGVPDENGNYIIGAFESLHSATISLLPDQAYKISATNYLISETPDAEDDNYTHIQYSLEENVSVDEIEMSALDDEIYSGEKYKDVEISPVQTMDVNGRTVSWVRHSYDYSYFSEYAEYYGWTAVDDNTVFLIYIEVCSDTDIDTAVTDALLTEAFEGVVLQ